MHASMQAILHDMNLGLGDKLALRRPMHKTVQLCKLI